MNSSVNMWPWTVDTYVTVFSNMANRSFNFFVSFSIDEWKENVESLNNFPFCEETRSFIFFFQLTSCKCCQQRLRSRWALFIRSVLCHVNLLARTIFENICFPFFLHISRQNWSWEEIKRSQNGDKAAPFSSVVVKTLLRAYKSQLQ